MKWLVVLSAGNLFTSFCYRTGWTVAENIDKATLDMLNAVLLLLVYHIWKHDA